jgi:hypothetical protein
MSDQLVPKVNPASDLAFESALIRLKNGEKLQRSGWNGKGQFVVMMPPLYLPPYSTQGTERKVNDRTAKWIGEDAPLDCQPGWTPSQGDLFANDWQVAE